jgi:hypothetical protein
MDKAVHDVGRWKREKSNPHTALNSYISCTAVSNLNQHVCCGTGMHGLKER